MCNYDFFFFNTCLNESTILLKLHHDYNWGNYHNLIIRFKTFVIRIWCNYILSLKLQDQSQKSTNTVPVNL